jgi:hypothetical protein
MSPWGRLVEHTEVEGKLLGGPGELVRIEGTLPGRLRVRAGPRRAWLPERFVRWPVDGPPTALERLVGPDDL